MGNSLSLFQESILHLLKCSRIICYTYGHSLTMPHIYTTHIKLFQS